MTAIALFDLDGVLLDSEEATLSALAAIATVCLGRRIRTCDLPPGAASAPRPRVLAGLGIDNAEEACAMWWDAALAAAPVPRLLPDVRDCLQALHASGTLTGLVTLQTRRRLQWLVPPDALALFSTTVCFHDAAPKPAPDGILLAMARLGASPRNAVFVGDTPDDMAAAVSAGVTPVGAAWGYCDHAELAEANPALVLSDPAQLFSALRDLGYLADNSG